MKTPKGTKVANDRSYLTNNGTSLTDIFFETSQVVPTESNPKSQSTVNKRTFDILEGGKKD